MFWTPITSDEGGFLAIARAWAHGAVLYRDVWVDRPQGLLVVFRLWDAVSGGSVASLRILAMIFGAGLVVAVAAATTSLAGRNAAAVAAILVGVSSASPAIEGHLANGELLSGTFAVAGFAVGCEALRRQGLAERIGRLAPGTMMVLSGVLGGLAISIKQSGFEGLVALSVWLVLAAALRWRSIRSVLVSGLRMSAGAAIVIAILAIHGALTGFSRWWFAFAGYRLDGRSVFNGANWERFLATASVARPIIWPLIAIGLTGLAAGGGDRLRRRRVHASGSDDRSWLMVMWVVAATAAFATGGQFHRHYWVTLTPALSAAAAILLTRRVRLRTAFTVATLLVVPTIVNAVGILRLGNDEIPSVASNDSRPMIDADVARWFAAHVRRDGGHSEDIYVLCASAAFYAVADEKPPYPYLWEDNVLKVPGALGSLRNLLGSPGGPDYIAVYQNADTCDPSGALGRVIEAHYEPYAVADGVPILIRGDEDAPRPVSRTS